IHLLPSFPTRRSQHRPAQYNPRRGLRSATTACIVEHVRREAQGHTATQQIRDLTWHSTLKSPTQCVAHWKNTAPTAKSSSSGPKFTATSTEVSKANEGRRSAPPAGPYGPTGTAPRPFRPPSANRKPTKPQPHKPPSDTWPEGAFAYTHSSTVNAKHI